MKKESSLRKDELLDMFENFSQEEIIEKRNLSNIFGGTSGGATFSKTPIVEDDCLTDPADTTTAPSPTPNV